MHIHMLLDHDAYVHDAYICDIRSLTMLHVCMMRLKFCDGRTNEPTKKAILGLGCYHGDIDQQHQNHGDDDQE